MYTYLVILTIYPSLIPPKKRKEKKRRKDVMFFHTVAFKYADHECLTSVSFIPACTIRTCK